MTTQQKSDVVELEARIGASPETVFSLLDNADGIARWFGSRAEMEPRPGGMIRVYINAQAIARGEVVELVPNERVVSTFGWEGEGHPVPPGSTRVEISLRRDGEATVVTLRHSGLTAEQAAEHTQGWQHYLPRLTAAAEGRDPGPDSMAGRGA